MIDIVNSILFLIHEAKFAMWDCPLEEYRGASDPIKLRSVLIDWNPTNTQPCPTLEQLEALNPADVAAFVEEKRKAARDAKAKTSISIMSNYNAYLLAHPGATLTAYLDLIESSMSSQG